MVALHLTQSPSLSECAEEMKWEAIREEFCLDREYIHLSLSVIAPHPKRVREAIRQHREGFDTNPGKYFIKKKDEMNRAVLESAAQYLNTSSQCIALTESTTMGLAVIYGGMKLHSGDEILTTYHEHYACSEALRFCARRNKCLLRKIYLYEDPSQVNREQILEHIIENIRPSTRVIALTWVHSSTGVKIPLAAIGETLKIINQSRKDHEKVLLCVDALHGLGVENVNVEELACDFFIAGCHKSLFGPRGTGLIWGSERGWERIYPTIPSFDLEVFWPWFEGNIPDFIAPKARLCSPGGFGAFEHKWALQEAFYFHLSVGKGRIHQRIQELNSYAKEKMRNIPEIKLLTPISESVSSGMVCFIIPGINPKDLVDLFEEEKIIIGQTPYRNTCNRFSIGILNCYDEIDTAIDLLKTLAKGRKTS